MTKEIEVSFLLEMGEMKMLIYFLLRCLWTPSTGFLETRKPWGRFSWGTSSLEGEQPHLSSLFRSWWIWQWQLCVYTLALTKKTFPRKLEGKDVPTGSTKLKTASGEEIKADRGKFVQVGKQWEMGRHFLGPVWHIERKEKFLSNCNEALVRQLSSSVYSIVKLYLNCDSVIEMVRQGNKKNEGYQHICDFRWAAATRRRLWWSLTLLGRTGSTTLSTRFCRFARISKCLTRRTQVSNLTKCSSQHSTNQNFLWNKKYIIFIYQRTLSFWKVHLGT